MSRRFYIEPIVTDSEVGGRANKYRATLMALKQTDNPLQSRYRVTMMDFGAEDLALTRVIHHDPVGDADAILTDHAVLAADPEVIVFPEDLSESLPARSDFRNSLEDLNLPVNWATPASDYLLLLKRIAAYFLIMQRVNESSGRQKVFSGRSLSTKMNELPAEIETGFFDAVGFFKLSGNGLNRNSTLRQFLNQIGHQFDIEMSFINDGQ